MLYHCSSMLQHRSNHMAKFAQRGHEVGVLPYRTMCKQCSHSGMQPTLDLFHTYAKVSNRYVKRMVLTCWRRRKERLTLHAAQPTGLMFVVMVTGLHFKDVGHVINSHWLSNSDDCFSTFFHNFP